MSMQEAPLLPRKLFFGNPDRTNAQLSPNGAKLSFMAPVDGVLNVWVGPADDPGAARPVTHDTGRGIPFYGWAYTSRHVLYLQDRGGDENWRLYTVDVESGDVADHTPLDGVQARLQHVSPLTPDQILIALNDRRKEYHDLYRLDLASGERTVVQRNDAFWRFLTDDHYRVRRAVHMTADGGLDLLQPGQEGGWDVVDHIAMEDAGTWWPVGFDTSGRILYLMDGRNRDTAALIAQDIERGTATVLAEDARADIAGVLLHPTEKTVQAAESTYARKQWYVLDPAIAGDLAFLRTVADGEVEVVSRTLDDRYWIVLYLLDNGPARYYRYERSVKTVQFLFSVRAELAGQPLARMHPVVIPSRDGFDLVSYYTLPLAADPDESGQPDRPVPMVLVVHGGPWARDTWGYHRLHQWLANRGYAALSVNFRGSTGMGKRLVNAATREWGGKMHDDLIDAVHWTIAQGIADPARVAIMGGSYGGYATLVGLTFTPEVFACGVDIVGPSNLVTLLETTPPYWQSQVELFATRVGDHRTEEGRAFLASRSPVHCADRICRPLLIGQGANDPRVKQAEADQIIAAMQRHAIPVTYVLYPDEGHGFARPENNLSFFAIAEAFLAQTLGGRVEPIGGDFAGSSVTVPVGASLVPGLAAALASRSPAAS
jgi:dipeptidyl aminopeptidase/acylaminoacyl peptidase